MRYFVVTFSALVDLDRRLFVFGTMCDYPSKKTSDLMIEYMAKGVGGSDPQIIAITEVSQDDYHSFTF